MYYVKIVEADEFVSLRFHAHREVVTFGWQNRALANNGHLFDTSTDYTKLQVELSKYQRSAILPSISDNSTCGCTTICGLNKQNESHVSPGKNEVSIWLY